MSELLLRAKELFERRSAREFDIFEEDNPTTRVLGECVNELTALRAKVQELEQSCTYWNELDNERCAQLLEKEQQLAASQLSEQRLREALTWAVSNAEVIRDFPKDDVVKYASKTIGVCSDALATPTSTEALDAYVAEKVKEALAQVLIVLRESGLDVDDSATFAEIEAMDAAINQQKEGE
jgi:hypothetical protein